MTYPYSAITLRYVHDVVTGEFINIGVVLYAPEQRFLGAKFAPNQRRISRLFSGADTSHIKRVVAYIEQQFDALSNEVGTGLSLNAGARISDVVRRVLPHDDSSLQWSDESAGLTPNPEMALESLYQRQVDRYSHPIATRSQKEKQVTDIFLHGLGAAQEMLVVKEISNELSAHTFRHAWKNGKWNCYEPISFDLSDSSSMKEKAMKVVGNGLTLADAEEYKVYFLLGGPGAEHDAEAFKQARGILNKYPTDHELIDEADLESFSNRVALEIAEHETPD